MSARYVHTGPTRIVHAATTQYFLTIVNAATTHYFLTIPGQNYFIIARTILTF